MKGKFFQREVLPFVAMVTVDITSVGTNIIFKGATKQGMSYVVYTVYSYAVSSVFFLPLAYLFHRKTVLPPLSISILGRIVFIGLIGITSQMIGNKAIELSDPTLASAISNLTPAFTFVLAIIFRMEKISMASASTQAKIVGTVVSISGALIVVLYSGPKLISLSSPSIPANQSLISSTQSGWILGGFLLFIKYFLVSIWFIFQAELIKKYPAEFVVAFINYVFRFVISAPVCLLIVEPNLNKWKLSADLALIAILYAGAIGATGTVIQTWGLRVKGPVYVASFRPLSIVIAAMLGVIFLGDSLYLGCVIGAVVISAGFYVLMWGKVKEAEAIEDSRIGRLESQSPENAPLLH